jgi:hypothetical protein
MIIELRANNHYISLSTESVKGFAWRPHIRLSRNYASRLVVGSLMFLWGRYREE